MWQPLFDAESQDPLKKFRNYWFCNIQLYVQMFSLNYHIVWFFAGV